MKLQGPMTLLFTLSTLFTEAALPSIELPKIPLAKNPFEKVDNSKIDKPATLKMLLKKETKSSLIEIHGTFNIYNPHTEEFVRTISDIRAFVKPSLTGLDWDKSYPELFQMRLVPVSEESSFLVDGYQYKGVLELFNIKGTLTLINEVDVENYLRATVHLDKEETLHREALDAAVIAARTNAYYQIGKSGSVFWHLDAAKVGYVGYGLTSQIYKIEKSIETTRHMIMELNEIPFPAEITEHSAGKTASYSAIYRKNVAVPKAAEALFAKENRKESTWKLTLTSLDLEKIGAKDAEIKLYKDPASEKVYGVKTSSGKEMTFFELQELIGKDRLKSNDFDLFVSQNKVEIVGYGKGHGVGLCLYSANQMAKEGLDASQILANFFPGSVLRKERTAPEITLEVPLDAANKN